MIHQINIDEQYEWFPSVDCDTDKEPSFMVLAQIYIHYDTISPDTIRNDTLENVLKLFDIRINLDDGDTMYNQVFNLEKVYVYMLKKLLAKLN